MFPSSIEFLGFFSPYSACFILFVLHSLTGDRRARKIRDSNPVLDLDGGDGMHPHDGFESRPFEVPVASTSP